MLFDEYLLNRFDIEQAWLQTLIVGGALVAIAILSNVITKEIILRIFRRMLSLTPLASDKQGIVRVARRLSNIVPSLVIQAGIGAVPNLAPAATTLIRNIAQGFTVLMVAMAVAAGMHVLNSVYERRPQSANRPIKGYIQVINIIVYAAAAILIIAALMDESPLLLLSGLGAMAAVLMLIFRDTILSLVASVQLSSNDMVRVGDWIEMPSLGVDGDVIDIALHTVKVQNFDKTIVTVPTYRLVSDAFKNWRGMNEAGARRIKRSLMIDQTTIRFLSDEEVEGLKRFSLLGEYIEKKTEEIERWNKAHPEAASDVVNGRRQTNVGAFRAYVLAYLIARPDISENLTLMVRQLDPTPEGLPLQLYCFTRTTVWPEYERIQSDIFDHILAILPEFDLLLFQEPTGRDLRKLSGRIDTA